MEIKTALNRMCINCEKGCFITQKDLKPHFFNNLRTCLLNPAKMNLAESLK